MTNGDHFSRSFVKESWYLILVAIVVKALCFFLFAFLTSPEAFWQGTFYVIRGDARDYLEPVNNLMKYGEHRTSSGFYSIRMPGYTPVFLFFRFITSEVWAVNFTLFTQVIFSGLSCYVLALISFKLFNSKKIFFTTFILYTISTYVSIWDNFILAESFALSSMIFSFYLLLVAMEKQHLGLLFASGSFLIWCFFLRPFMIPLVLPYCLILLIADKKNTSMKRRSKNILIFLIPLIVAEGSWVLRNYLVLNEIVFTQTRISYNDGDSNSLDKGLSSKLYVGEFSSSFGGDHTFWNPRGTTYWFFNNSATKFDFPKELFNDTLTPELLLSVKEMCIKSESNLLTEGEKKAYDMQIKETLSNFMDTYKKEHPFHYYVTSRLIHLERFIFHSGVYNLPFPAFEQQTILQKCVKAFYSILYLTTFTFGLIACLFLLWLNRKRIVYLTFFLIPVYLVLLLPMVYKEHEYRFTALAYPGLVVALAYGIIKTKDFLIGIRSRGTGM